MNTNKLKSFAQIARRILMEGVLRRITEVGSQRFEDQF